MSDYLWDTPAERALLAHADDVRVLRVLEETGPWPGAGVDLVTADMRAATR